MDSVVLGVDAARELHFSELLPSRDLPDLDGP